MPTLASSSSILQLAVAVNAVFPVLISDFEEVRDKTAESLLRKIKEYRPDFVLKERDRLEFVSFTFQSSKGLRHAKFITGFTAVLSIMLSSISLAGLCCAAIWPDNRISVKQLLFFVGVSLVGAPLFYLGRNRYLRWLYSVQVAYGTNEKVEAVFFADCVDLYLKHKESWEPLEQTMDSMIADVHLTLWKMAWKRRWRRLQMKLGRIWDTVYFSARPPR